jgi:hypothetical protein
MLHLSLDFSDSSLATNMGEEKSDSAKGNAHEDKMRNLGQERPDHLLPRSDSRLTAVQREASEAYKALSPSTRSAYVSAGDLSSVNAEYEAARIADALGRAALGLKYIKNSSPEIQRSPDKRYMLGSEFAIVAIVAIAGIAKRRVDLNQVEVKAIIDGDDDGNRPCEIIYRRQTKKDNAIERLREGRGRAEPVESFNFSSSGYDSSARKNIPDWLISLDTSAAKEAGYLFNSVLRRPTVLITLSDTFVSLGERHFLDALLAWLIVDLNKNKITEFWKGETKVVAIANGESIELPVWEDIVEFYQNKPKQARPDNLLTVVLKRNLDRELIAAALSDVVVPGDAKIVQGKRADGKGESRETEVRLEDILPTMFSDD